MKYSRFYKQKEISPLKVTKGMETFLKEDILPNYIIYSKKDVYAFCTGCQSEVDLKAFDFIRQTAETKCPVCKRTALFKAKGKLKKTIFDSGLGLIFDKDKDNDMCVRYFDVKKIYRTDGIIEDYSYHECMREYFNDRGEYVTFDYPSWRAGGWNKCNIRQYGNYKGYAGDPIYHVNLNAMYRNIYSGNIKNVIKDTPWKYSLMDKIFKMEFKNANVSVPRCFLMDYIQSPACEYLYKVGFKTLCHEITNMRTIYQFSFMKKTLPEILKVNKVEYKKLLKIGNPTAYDLIKAQTVTNYNFNDEEYDMFRNIFGFEQYSDTSRSRDYESYSTYSSLSLFQLNKYVNEYRAEHSKFPMITYIDYLRMATELNYDMNNSFVVFPKNLQEVHDLAVKITNERRKEKEREEAKQKNVIYNKLKTEYEKKYKFDNGNMTIVVPNGCEDICAEGQKLHHCVGTYIDRVCKGSSVILFVRNIDDIAKPFYTMELQGNTMIQVRGFGNKSVTPNVRDFITDFAKKKKLVMSYIA